jgi:hypothetical protein
MTSNPYDSVLNGVSCSSATACTAVGDSSQTSNNKTLAEAWNGTAWSVQTTPNPSGANYSLLNGVSCRSANACTAVGGYQNNSSGIAGTVVEAWNGTAWSIQTTPNPGRGFLPSLGGVSCSSATACTAVGDSSQTSNNKTLAEAWNGTAWSVQTTPNPGRGFLPSLGGVSCSSVTACTAVGSYNKSTFAFGTLAEAWNGAAWSIQTTPNPSGTTSSVLSGVSCNSANACTAVGSYQNAHIVQTLAEAEHG